MNNFIGNELPGSGGASLAYMAIAAIVAVYLARKTDQFGFALVLFLWLFGQPVLEAYYVIKLGPFDLQPNRLLLLFLVIALPLANKAKIGQTTQLSGERRTPSYEIYIAALVGLITLAIAINWEVLPPKKLIATPLEPLTFLLLYYFAKKIVTAKLLNVVLTAFVFMAIANAMIAFAQIADPLFLRTAPLRPAFGNIWRAYGVFPSEYVLGAFQIVAIFILVTHFRQRTLKLIFVPLLIASVILTFHRLDLIILMFCGILYFSKYASKSIRFIGIFATVVALFATIPAYIVLTGGESQLVDERLSENTITGRLVQYGAVISILPKHPLGLGTDNNPIYQQEMIDRGIYRDVRLPNGRRIRVAVAVHNGYLAIGMKYGFVAMIVFGVMMWKMGYYFYRRSRKDPPTTIIPFFAVLVWATSNLSNGIVEFRAYNIMIVAMLTGLFAGAYRKGLLGDSRK